MELKAGTLYALEKVYGKLLALEMPKQKLLNLMDEVDRLAKPLDKVEKVRKGIVEKYQGEKAVETNEELQKEFHELAETTVEVELKPLDEELVDRIELNVFQLNLLIHLKLIEDPRKDKEVKKEKKKRATK